jgi:transcriptional regulator with XRE-family HTH domain
VPLRKSTTPSKKTPAFPETNWLARRVSANVKLLKGMRGLSDQAIADRGGYTSRQVFYSRLNGRTDYTSEDFARIAAALNVEPQVLFYERQSEVVQWTEDHPDYVGPKYQPQTAKGE